MSIVSRIPASRAADQRFGRLSRSRQSSNPVSGRCRSIGDPTAYTRASSSVVSRHEPILGLRRFADRRRTSFSDNAQQSVALDLSRFTYSSRLSAALATAPSLDVPIAYRRWSGRNSTRGIGRTSRHARFGRELDRSSGVCTRSVEAGMGASVGGWGASGFDGRLVDRRNAARIQRLRGSTTERRRERKIMVERCECSDGTSSQ